MPPFSIDASSSCPLTIQGDINDGGLLQRQQEERPSQIKFVRAAQMSLFANVTCWPPLGQVTFLKRRVEGTETGAKDKVCHSRTVDSLLPQFVFTEIFSCIASRGRKDGRCSAAAESQFIHQRLTHCSSDLLF